jgi:hypothetical protein
VVVVVAVVPVESATVDVVAAVGDDVVARTVELSADGTIGAKVVDVTFVVAVVSTRRVAAR